MKRRDVLRGMFASVAGVVVKPPEITNKETLSTAEVAETASGLTLGQKTALERELRRYIKSTGGFRKDLHRNDLTHAKNILAVMGRTHIGWDFGLHVDGMEDAEAKHRPQVDEV